MTSEPMTTRTTLIRNLDLIIAWDESERRHVYLENADLVFKGNEVVHVGPGYRRPAGRHDRGPGPDGDPRPCQRPQPSLLRTRQQGLTEEYGQRQARAELALRIPAGVRHRAEDAGPSITGGDLRAAEERRHHGDRPLDEARRLARRSRLDRHPRRGLPDVSAPGYWYTKNGHDSGLCLGREGRREGLRGSDEDHRRAPRSIRAAASPA